MKLKGIGGSLEGVPLKQQGDSGLSVGSSRGSVFDDMLMDSLVRDVKEELDMLFKNIEEHSERLVKHFTLEELLRYKEAVRRFLNVAVNRMYLFKKLNYFDRKGRYTTFTLVKTVDKKLEELTCELICNQGKKLRVVNLVDDIRGLLMDLLL